MTSSISKAEKSYIQAGLVTSSRPDGRLLEDFRSIALQTGVAPLANGSARVNLGGTEIVVASKLEVTSGEGGLVCTVTCSPAAYPHLTSSALDDLQTDMTTLFHQTLSHPTLRPANLSILPGQKSWQLSLDAIVQADSGNVYDALFIAARAALWDTKVPRTRSIQYTVGKKKDSMDIDSGFDTRKWETRATDFELLDYWEEGEVLEGRDAWPVCITLNVVETAIYLDASLQEEAAVPLRVLLLFSFRGNTSAQIQAIRTLGSAETNVSNLRNLLQVGEKHARILATALQTKLRDEDTRRNQKAKRRFEMRK